MKGINVLSLFDGMRCGRIATDYSKIRVGNYFSSEINDKSILIGDKNYPQDIPNKLGDVRNIKCCNLPNIDLLIGGSPCQNLSIVRADDKNISSGLLGDKSSLFYQFLRIKEESNPTYFMLENVASMKESDKDIISELLGVEPILIDANLVSAQDRARYFWTNIPVAELPKDEGVVLKDIMLNNVDEKYYYDRPFVFNGYDKKIIATLEMKGHDQMKRVYNPNGKCGTLTACRGGNLQKKVFQNGRVRKLTPNEYELLQSVPVGYTDGVADTHRYNMLGDGWNAKVIAHIFSFLPDEWKED